MRPPEIAAPTAIAARVIASSAELHALASDWRALWRRCAGQTPFTTPAWLLAWWEHLGSGELRTLALLAGDQLLALAPLHVTADGTLQFLGTGVSDYGDALVEPGHEAEFVRAFRELARTSRDVRRVDLRQLPANSPLLVLGRAEPDVPCPVLRLSGSPDSSLRKEISYEHRRLARRGTVAFETAAARTLDALLDALFALHAARWADSGGGVLADERVRAFHRTAARALLEAGLLRLHALCVAGEIVAVYYGFSASRRAYYYLGGFAPAWQRYGVGNLVIDFAARSAAAEGATAFDFLRGQEPYKYHWGARDEPTWRAHLDARRH